MTLQTKLNSSLLNLKFHYDESTSIVNCEFTADQYLEGPPEIIHTGIITSVMEETMMEINNRLNYSVVLNNLTVRYLNSAFIGEKLYIRGWLVKNIDKKIENRVEIENEIGKIVARGIGLYTDLC